LLDIDRNFHRSGNTGAQLYGRARGGRGRVSGDETQPGRRGARTISQSQQLPKLPSQSTDQNLSDVGNEEWETASESSDVLAHHHVHETKPDEAKSSAGHEAGGPSGKRDQKKTFAGYRGDRSDRDSVSEPRSGSFDTRNSQHGPRNINNGNSRMNSRGSRDQAMSRNSTTSAADAANKLVLSPSISRFTSSKEVMFSSALVCPFVCLLAGLCKNNSSNFHKLQRKGCLRRNHYILVVICTMLHAQGCRLRNDLYCVEWDVKLYYTIPYHRVRVGLWLRLGPRWCMPQEMGFHRQRTVWMWRGPDNVTHRQLLSIDQV